MKISAVILTRNEELMINDCLKSLKGIADEIVIVDDYSTDKTIEIAKKYTKNIFLHKGQGYVEPSRNFAIDKATHEWILVLDADERIPESLAKQLKEIALENTKNVITIPRKNIIFNKWMKGGIWWPDYQIRFFKKGTVVWQNEIHSAPQITGEVFRLNPEENCAITHYNYSSVSQYVTRLDRYTTIEAENAITKGKTVVWQDAIGYPVHDFLKTFFAQKGYIDGLHGLCLSLLQAFYAEVVFAKIWEHKKFEEVNHPQFLKHFIYEVALLSNEFRYWAAHVAANTSKNIIKKTFLRIKQRSYQRKSH